MIHKRRWSVSTKYGTPQELAEALANHSWCLCNGFRLGEYLFLNDAFSEDGAQEYGVLKDLGDGTYKQVESITFSWCDYARALELIQQALAGEFDTTDISMPAQPTIEAPEQHGRCSFCA